ncbi:hypothetical protein [Ensifer sp. ENS03]|uniref:hypothetical protein n=1 Tax=Ensifer sp. ENS03 TaxID=2769283 RepID=UPI0017809A46|nr:hypothetical protein [Ensifer sp. ENS03]MBD9558446.1 hypothetical protein [Ensifer sp. ENS03]
MWNLPTLPTDNLYKLMTFAGMALMLAAFYILYSGVNREFRDTGPYAYARQVQLKSRLEDVGLKPKPLPDHINESPYLRYEEYRDLIRSLPAGHPQATQLRDLNEDALMLGVELKLSEDAMEGRHVSFLCLAALGFLFLTLGAFRWYFGYQRYQDVIAYANALEATTKARGLGLSSQPVNLQKPLPTDSAG